MALLAAKLISDNVLHPDGKPAADTTIGGIQEAGMCSGKFECKGV